MTEDDVNRKGRIVNKILYFLFLLRQGFWWNIAVGIVEILDNVTNGEIDGIRVGVP